MKREMKEKEVRNIVEFADVALCVSYCGAAYMLEGLPPTGYTAGVYGWNYDVYEFGGIVVCTGYRRIKGIWTTESQELVKQYNDRARRVVESRSADWNVKKSILADIRREFAAEAKRIFADQ